jgi:precorrin-2/cobalt-factor-2 C20-methyltransferase
MSAGKLVGVGLGPGDPDLVTLKALNALRAAPVIAFFAKAGRVGHARKIAGPHLPGGQIEEPLAYPVTTEIPFDDAAYGAALSSFYEAGAMRLAAHLDAGRDVALLCEGDPLFYGSFMHLYERLRGRYSTTVVPGVTAMSGGWSAAGLSMTWGDDGLSVLAGTAPFETLIERLRAADAAVVMKIGRNLDKVRAALNSVGRLKSACYVEYATQDNERAMPLAEFLGAAAPYFSLVLVPGNGRRP